ncbi:putative aliphatic sulfonates transport permease protein SsuC [Clavibacter michiganensis]|uniref:Putative aliphatic sulfonates transport permease protein SsuC n=1 Tax=Clavibacter michiganensis TaxID=28447 RepID=A0A251YEJ4_9MICO|nr:ABC transporter permease [Clavibacter michiganensis]OUE22508.1 putative aliphatic sulfonates transport permease protein SsuC [Clavibacter michiganensis]
MSLDALPRSATRRWLILGTPLLSILALLVLWDLAVRVFRIPRFVLPAPLDAFAAIGDDWDSISRGIVATSQVFVLGFLIGASLGFVLAIVMSSSIGLFRILYPIMIVSQAIPVVAIGAALVIWLGFGLAPKLVVVAMIVFFPVLVNVLDGLRSVDPDSVNLARAMGASRWRTFLIIKMPATYTPLFSALKMSATFSVTGAILAESLASTTGGLGVYLSTMQGRFNTAGVFAAIIVLASIGLTAFLLISLWESSATPWRRSSIVPRRRRHVVRRRR